MSQPTGFGPDLGARLNAARQRQGVSVAALAELTNLSVDNVRELLNGKRTPTPTVTEGLLRVLDLEGEIVDELRAATGRWKSSFSGEEVALDAD